MTRKKIAHPKKSTKRPQKTREEQPLPEGLVERAAARAGIAEPGSSSAPAEPAAPDTDGNTRHRERYLSKLSDLVSGGLWVSTDKGADLPPERALCRVAGSLLKATMIATYFSTDDADSDPDVWVPNCIELRDHEQIDALAGIIALLQAGPVVTERLLMEDEFRESGDRVEQVEDLRARARAAGVKL